MLAFEGERIGLQRQEPAVGTDKLELVDFPLHDPGNENLPYPAFDSAAHGMAAAVPTVERTDDADPPRIRRPDRERHAGDTIDRTRMRAEFLVSTQMSAFRPQVNVQLASIGAKRYGSSTSTICPAVSQRRR